MAREAYKKQAALLLNVLPEVAKEPWFALHGGTAINLFVRDMPRMSVDIDLTYLPFEDRATSLANIAVGLERIKMKIEKVVPDVHVMHRKEDGKLLISSRGIDIKLEINLVVRGTLSTPVKMTLCSKAQTEFDVFCTMNVVPIGQLYGGKICAALDRQHPRDLFDVKYLLENEGFTKEVKEGFLLGLSGHGRPINEVLAPNFQDQRSALDNQFEGMSEEPFTYEDYEDVRKKLIKTIHENLTKKDKEFLISLQNLTPDWSLYDFSPFPAVSWKLQNLQKLKDSNPEKYKNQYEDLNQKLGTF